MLDNSALARLEQTESKAEPDLSALSALKPADLVFHLWQRYASTAIFPLSGSSTSIRREMVTSNSHNIVRIEGKIVSILQKAIDSTLSQRSKVTCTILTADIIAYISFCLTKQKKNDYKPKDDELSFARTNTDPCQLICAFVEVVRDSAKDALSGKNAEAFFTEVGVALHR